MKNKFAKFAMGNAAGSVVLTFLFGILGAVLAVIAIGFGIKGLVDYNRKNSIGGKWGSISAIAIGVLMIIIVVIRLVSVLNSPYY